MLSTIFNQRHWRAYSMTYHNRCRCGWTQGSGPWGCGAQQARVGNWELWGHFLLPEYRDSGEMEADCLWDQLDILTSMNRDSNARNSRLETDWIKSQSDETFWSVGNTLHGTESFIYWFIQVSPTLFFDNTQENMEYSLLSERLHILHTKTWLMIHKTHFH